MARTKAILAVSSLGLGTALVFMATTIQRDRFAFTQHGARNFDAVATLAIVAPEKPSLVVEPASVTEQTGTIRIEALQVKPAVRTLQRTKPAARPEPMKTTAPPCRPVWRELESGPSGRSVRDVCFLADEVPQS
jgi:hypothetical protein